MNAARFVFRHSQPVVRSERGGQGGRPTEGPAQRRAASLTAARAEGSIEMAEGEHVVIVS